MAVTNYHLAEIVTSYLIDAAENIINDMYGFLMQFNVNVEVEYDELEEPVVDFGALEKWLQERTEENGIE